MSTKYTKKDYNKALEVVRGYIVQEIDEWAESCWDRDEDLHEEYSSLEEWLKDARCEAFSDECPGGIDIWEDVYGKLTAECEE